MIRKLTLATALTAVIASPRNGSGRQSSRHGNACHGDECGAGLKSGRTITYLKEAEGWVGKPVYSSDGQKLGEVAAIQRAADNNVTGMYADIGGFMGMGEHRIKLRPRQINLKRTALFLS